MVFTRMSTLAVLVLGAAAAPLVPSNNLTIVQLVEAIPELSTLLTALKAANLTGALSGPGPYTIFAPTDEAFAALPPARLNSLIEPCLIEPCDHGNPPVRHSPNIVELQAVLQYHVIESSVYSKNLEDRERIETLEGESVVVTLRSNGAFVDRSRVVKADLAASNGVVHTIDKVLEPLGVNHLYFRFINGDYNCAQVDAAPRMPSAIFDTQNAVALEKYIDAVLAHPWSNALIELGTCGAASREYVDVVPLPSRCEKVLDPFPGRLSNGTIDWAPTKLMQPICVDLCDCNYGSSDPSTDCTDVPDNPLAGKWCSLCGPKFNKPVNIDCFQLGHFDDDQ